MPVLLRVSQRFLAICRRGAFLAKKCEVYSRESRLITYSRQFFPFSHNLCRKRTKRRRCMPTIVTCIFVHMWTFTGLAIRYYRAREKRKRDIRGRKKECGGGPGGTETGSTKRARERVLRCEALYPGRSKESSLLSATMVTRRTGRSLSQRSTFPSAARPFEHSCVNEQTERKKEREGEISAAPRARACISLNRA